MHYNIFPPLRHILKKTGGVTGEMENEVDVGDCVDARGDWGGEVGGRGGNQEACYAVCHVGQGFLVMKKWVASMMKDPEADKIAVMADPHQEDAFCCV